MALGTFDYESVQEQLQLLETYYEDFYRAIQEMDSQVAKTLDVGNDSAIAGNRAEKLLNNWMTYCGIYKSYYNTFRNWSVAIINASGKYTDYEGTYQDATAEANGLGEIERTLTDDEMKSFDQLRQEALVASSLISGGATVAGNSVVIDGTNYPIQSNGYDGNYVEIGGEKYYIDVNNGKITTVKTPDGTVSVPGSMEDTLRSRKESMTTEEWNAYKGELEGEERAAADYIDSAATVISDEDISAQLKEESGVIPEDALIDLPTKPNCTDADDKAYKESAKEIISAAEETESYVYGITEEAFSYSEYYDNVVKKSEYYQNLSSKEQDYYDSMVEHYCEDWSQSYNEIVSATDGGIFVSDGNIYDADSWYRSGRSREESFDLAYETASTINNSIGENMSPDEFAAEMAIFDQYV